MVQIRKATQEDLELIQKLNQALFKYEKEFSSDYIEDWSYSTHGIRNLNNRIQSGIVYIAFTKDNNGIGYICGNVWSNYHGRKDPVLAEIEHMFITESYRLQGIGKKLIEIFFVQAKKDGANTVEVKLLSKNTKAYEFYKKLGLTLHTLAMEKSI